MEIYHKILSHWSRRSRDANVNSPILEKEQTEAGCTLSGEGHVTKFNGDHFTFKGTVLPSRYTSLNDLYNPKFLFYKFLLPLLADLKLLPTLYNAHITWDKLETGLRGFEAPKHSKPVFHLLMFLEIL